MVADGGQVSNLIILKVRLKIFLQIKIKVKIFIFKKRN